MLWYLDGSDFPKGNGFYCTDNYENETSLVIAISKCRNNINCSMVSALNCDTSEYLLCGKSSELIAKDEACYFQKKSIFLKYKISIMIVSIWLLWQYEVYSLF